MNKYYVERPNHSLEAVYASCVFIEYGGTLVFYDRLSPTSYAKDRLVVAYSAGEWLTFHQEHEPEEEQDG